MKTEAIRDIINQGTQNGYTYLPTDKLKVDRLCLSKKEGEAFTESIKTNGFYDPLVINREFCITDGRKRYFAAVRLGLEYVPCVFTENDYVPSYVQTVKEASSEVTHYFDKATAIRVLTDKHLLTQESVAALIGRSQSYVANKLRLLKFTAEQRLLITEADLTERHARAFLKIKDSGLCTATILHVIEGALTVSETEEYVDCLCLPSFEDGSENSNCISQTMKNIDKLTSTAHSMGVLLKMNKTEDLNSVSYTIKIYK